MCKPTVCLLFCFSVVNIILGQSTRQNGTYLDETYVSRLISERFTEIEEKLVAKLDSFKQQSAQVTAPATDCLERFHDLELEMLELKGQLAKMHQEKVDSQQLINELVQDNKRNKEKIRDLERTIHKMQETTEPVGHVTSDNCTNCVEHNRQKKALTVYAFSAYLTYEIDRKPSDTVLIFDGIVLNEGNDYSTHTGKYTVPQNGVYVFHFSIEWTNDNQDIVDACLMLDGAQMSCAVIHPVGTHGQMSSNTVVLRASRGQHVWIENVYGMGAFYGHPKFRITTFSGYLLY